MDKIEQENEIRELKEQVANLEQRLKYLEVNSIKKLPNTSLISSNFLSRAFAVFGHYLVAALIVSIPLYAVAFIIALIGGLAFQ